MLSTCAWCNDFLEYSALTYLLTNTSKLMHIFSHSCKKNLDLSLADYNFRHYKIFDVKLLI